VKEEKTFKTEKKSKKPDPKEIRQNSSFSQNFSISPE
jgi:hypothetical protein